MVGPLAGNPERQQHGTPENSQAPATEDPLGFGRALA
jgi:hypothetical protein